MPEKRILLVEDDPGVRAVLKLALSREGYSTDEVATVADAMAMLDARPYAVALVDWHLPDGSGLLIADTAEQLGAATFVMSGYLPQMPGGRAYGHETIMKPVKPAEILNVVAGAIGAPNEAD